MAGAGFLPPAIIEIKALADKAIAEFKEVNQELEKMENSGGKAGAGISKMEKASKLATGALLGLGAAFAGFAAIGIKEALDAETVLNKLGSTMSAVGVNTEANREKIKALTDGYVNLGFSGDSAASGFEKLLRVTGDVDESQKLLALSADVARVQNIGLAEASGIVAKASMGNAKAFKEMGIELDSTLPKSEAIKKAMEELNDRIGKQAENATKTFAVQLQIVKERFNDTAESLGAVLLPLIKEFLTKINQTIEFIKRNASVFKILGGIILTVTVALAAYNAAVKVQLAITKAYSTAKAFATGVLALFTKQQQAANTAMKANPIGLVVSALTLLVGALMLAWNKSEAFRKVIITIGKAGLMAFSSIIPIVANVYEAIAKIITGPMRLFLGALSKLPGVGKYAKGGLDLINQGLDGISDLGDKASKKASELAKNLDKLNKPIKIGGGKGIEIPDMGQGGKGGKSKGGIDPKAKEAMEKANEDALAITKDYKEKLAEIQSTYNDKYIEAEQTYLEKVDDLNAEAAERILSLRQDAEDRKAQLTQENAERIADLQKNYDEKLLDLANAYEEKKASLLADKTKRDERLRSSALAKIQELEKDYQEKVIELNERAVEKIAELNAKALEDKAEIESKYSETVIGIKNKFNARYEELTKDLASNVAKLETENKNKIAEIEKAHAERIADIKEKYAETEISATRKRDEDLASLAKDNQSKIYEIVKAGQERLAAIVAESVNRLRDAYIKGTEIDVGDLFKGLVEAGTASADSLVEQMRTRLTNIKTLAANAAKLSSLGFSQTFIEQVVAQGPEIGNELATSILNAAPGTVSEIQNLFNAIETQSNTGLDTLAKSMNSGSKLATAELTAAYQAAQEETKTALALQNQEYLNAQSAINTQFQTTMAEAVAERDKLITEANLSLAEALTKQSTAFTAAKTELQTKYEEAVAALKKERDEALADAEKNYKEAIAKVDAELAKDIAKTNADLTKSLADSKKALDDATAKIQKDLTTALEDSNKEYLEALEDAKKDYDKAITDAKTALDKSIADSQESLAKALTKVETDLTKAITDTQNKLTKALTDAEEALKKAREKADKDFADAIDKAAKDFEEKVAKIKSLTDSTKAAIQEVRDLISSMQAEAAKPVIIAPPTVVTSTVTDTAQSFVGRAGRGMYQVDDWYNEKGTTQVTVNAPITNYDTTSDEDISETIVRIAKYGMTAI